MKYNKVKFIKTKTFRAIGWPLKISKVVALSYSSKSSLASDAVLKHVHVQAMRCT